jgi:hypothetical protein
MEPFKTRILADAKIKEIYDKNPQFTMLEDIIPTIQNAGAFGDELTLCLLDFSLLLTSCTEIVAEVVTDYNEAYQFRRFYEFEKYEYLRDKEFGVKDAEQMSKNLSRDQIQDELVANSVADRLKAKERSWYSLISIIQTRVGFLKQEQLFSRGQK